MGTSSEEQDLRNPVPPRDPAESCCPTVSSIGHWADLLHSTYYGSLHAAQMLDMLHLHPLSFSVCSLFLSLFETTMSSITLLPSLTSSRQQQTMVPSLLSFYGMYMVNCGRQKTTTASLSLSRILQLSPSSFPSSLLPLYYIRLQASKDACRKEVSFECST